MQIDSLYGTAINAIMRKFYRTSNRVHTTNGIEFESNGKKFFADIKGNISELVLGTMQPIQEAPKQEIQMEQPSNDSEIIEHKGIQIKREGGFYYANGQQYNSLAGCKMRLTKMMQNA